MRDRRALAPGTQEHRRQRGRQCQRDQARDQGGRGNRQGELPVELTGDTGDERRRHEHRRQDERDGHQRAANFVHRAVRGLPRRHPLIEIAFHVLHHHDRIVDDDADREDEPEERERVQREAERLEHRERADERHGNRDERNDRRAPRLEEEDDDHDHEDRGLEDRFLNLTHRLRDELRGVVDDVVVEPARKLRAEARHQRLHAPGGVERV